MKKFVFFLLSLLGLFFASRSIAQCSPTTVPYFQDFSAITSNNQLPACWAASNLGGTCLTFTNMGAVAAFSFSPGGNSQFFTEAIQLHAAVVYSISLWYKVSAGTPGNWTNLSIDLGTSQSTVGMSGIVSLNTILTNTNYVALTATFVAPSSSNYYFSIGATGQPTANAQFLYWDDFELTAPCSMNPVFLTATASQSTVCAGNCLTLSASGADTYAWSNGTFGSSVVVCPGMTQFYSVMGSNSVTTCTAVVSPTFTVNPAPQLAAFVSPSLICTGETAQLQAFGASTYTWSNNQNGNAIQVSPTLNTTYSVTGENSFACTATATLVLTVDACIGVNEEQRDERLIYPNPVDDFLHLRFEENRQVKLSIQDVDGKVLYEFRSQWKGQSIDTKFLRQGIYLLRIESEGKISYHKLIKN